MPEIEAPYGPLAFFADFEPAASDFRADVIEGLSQPQPRLNPKYFYDAYGSHLFDKICETDEYYVTRTETAMLADFDRNAVAEIGGNAAIIEYGSGSGAKISLLLDALASPREYVAIDISRDHLINAATDLAEERPSLSVGAICADFTKPLDLPEVGDGQADRRVGFFPGSTIGNLDRADARKFLSQASDTLAPGGAFLIGVDLKKDEAVLNAAYNDKEGVTAAFNHNILKRLQRELDAELDPAGFEHFAYFNHEDGRIEMHLRATSDQEIVLDGRRFAFRAGETIHTESSHKYGLEEFQEVANDAGFGAVRSWTDPDGLFSMHLLQH